MPINGSVTRIEELESILETLLDAIELEELTEDIIDHARCIQLEDYSSDELLGSDEDL